MTPQMASVVGLVTLLGAGTSVTAQDANAILANAVRTMGAGNLKTIRYSGRGFNFTFGQNFRADDPWTRFSLTTHAREIDFDAPASHVHLFRSAVDNLGGGGIGLPIVDQTQNQFIGPNAPWAQQVDIWITPSGFLKRAMAARATLKSQKDAACA
jgi:hypothetical protein